MSQEASPRTRPSVPPPTPLNVEAEIDSGVPERIFRAILTLYKWPHPQFPAHSVLVRFETHPDPRIRMAAVDGVFVDALRGAADPAGAQIEVLKQLLPRFQHDSYVLRCLINRAVQQHLSEVAPAFLLLLCESKKPDWLVNAYGALYPLQGYAPLREALSRHPGASWEAEAMKFLYRLDPGAAFRDFPDYLPQLHDKRLWRVLETLGPEMTADFVPLLRRFVVERDARVRRVCVAILRWLVGRERTEESFALMALPEVERTELLAIAAGEQRGHGVMGAATTHEVE